MENTIFSAMTNQFILWRCLHAGPLSSRSINSWPKDSQIPWENYRERNLPLLRKLTDMYGACAILAHIGDEVIGQLRFYPRAVCDLLEAGGLCLLQDFPAGPTADLVDHDFPSLDKMSDKTLIIHCCMIAPSQKAENPYLRKGIGSAMVKFLIQWAADNGWDRLEVDAFEDLPIIYEITGSAGHTFWEKLGFSIVSRHAHPHLQGRDEFVLKLEQQARDLGIATDAAKERIIMRLDVRPAHESGARANRS
ncbi:GNAT family N-acetyltransferase [candidate division KSB1 bacterium]|nr:GNAT family N-acetyltransferase [candidate division KSB1 bacterium]